MGSRRSRNRNWNRNRLNRAATGRETPAGRETAASRETTVDKTARILAVVLPLIIAIITVTVPAIQKRVERKDSIKKESAEYKNDEEISAETREYSANVRKNSQLFYIYNNKLNRYLCEESFAFTSDTISHFDDPYIDKWIDSMRTIYETRYFQSIEQFPEEPRQNEFISCAYKLVYHYKTLSIDELCNLVATLKEIMDNKTFQEKSSTFIRKQNQLVLNDERTKADSTMIRKEASLVIHDTIPYYSSLDSFKSFADYLVNKKNIVDPDVLFLYGVTEIDLNVAEKAIESGANLDVTDVELVAKYSNEYEEYYIEHYNDNKLYEVEPNEIDDGKEKKTFDWDGFIRFINVLQLVVVLLLVVVVVLYINSIKKKFDSHNDSNNKIMEELQKRSEEFKTSYNLREEIQSLKTDLDWERENANRIVKVWAEMKKTIVDEEEDEKYGDEEAKGDEAWKNAEFFIIKVMETPHIMGTPRLSHRLHKDDNSDKEVKYKNIYIVPFGGRSGGTSELLGNLLSMKKEELDNTNIWLKKELIKEELDVLVNESFKALLDLFKKKKEFTWLTKEIENEIREKLFNNADNSDRLFCEWLRKYLEQNMDSKGVRNRRIGDATHQISKESYIPGKGHNLQEHTIKQNCLSSILDLLELEIDYNLEYILTDYFRNVFHDFQERLDYYYETYNYLKDLWIIHEKIKTMIDGLTQKNSNGGDTFNRLEESKTSGSQKSMSNDTVKSEKDISSCTEDSKGKLKDDDCLEEKKR